MSISASVWKRRINNAFNEIVLKAVDSSLEQIGRSMKTVVYYHLEKDFILREEIPTETKQFSACLKMIFGEGAEYLIKMVIVEKLYDEINEELTEIEEYSLADYVREARKRYFEGQRRKHERGDYQKVSRNRYYYSCLHNFVK